MKLAVTAHDIYREQLGCWARSLAHADNEAVRAALEEDCPIGHVRMFTQNNVEKRREKLQRQCNFVVKAYPELAAPIVDYAREVAVGAYDRGSSDGDGFLRWLIDNHALSAEQLDHVTCQRARFEVEALAREDRRGHVQFQEYRSVARYLAGEVDRNPRLRIHLNPIRAWVWFHTPALVGEETALPARVVFFPTGSDIAATLVESQGQVLVEELASRDPLTLGEWVNVTESATRCQLLTFCRDLAAAGLVAFS